MLSIEIIDLGINNISSVKRAFSENVNASVSVIGNGSESRNPGLIVLPGLGFFEKGMFAIESRGFRSLLTGCAQDNIAVAGICLGMQLLGDSSQESPSVQGLGLIPGESKKFPKINTERIPNTGWNSTSPNKMKKEFPALDQDMDFYFVHSYYFEPKFSGDLLSSTEYGNFRYASSILKDKTIGFQFHPEKSAVAGKSLIKDLVRWASDEI